VTHIHSKVSGYIEQVFADSVGKPKQVLNFVAAQGFRFSDQQNRLTGQLSSSIDCRNDCRDDIIQVDKRLSVTRMPGKIRLMSLRS
jgi:hypothetical protein